MKNGTSFGRPHRNMYEPGLPPPVQRRAPLYCHVPAARRPSSFELGGGKGNNGLAPGTSGFGVGPGLHDTFAHDTGTTLCPHPACLGDRVARYLKAHAA